MKRSDGPEQDVLLKSLTIVPPISTLKAIMSKLLAQKFVNMLTSATVCHLGE
jgi:hypothetical protein